MSLKRIGLVLFFALSALLPSYAGPDKALGKELFIANCASCHNKNMKDKLTGPPLGGAQAKWNDDKALYAWIRNSQSFLATGHPAAVAIWNEYKPVLMNAFPKLTDDEIASMLLYIDEVYKGPGDTVDPGKTPGGVTDKKESGTSNWVFIGLALMLGLLAFALMRIVDNLNNVARVQDGGAPVQRSWVNSLSSKGFIAFTVFAVVLLFGHKMVDNATKMGRTQGYEPDQPIKFSHKLHAGLNKIDCQYCHDSARRSKHSSIPGASTCMNCHSAVKVGSQYGTAELTKIYASIGWNPLTNQYIDNYDNWPESKIDSLYKKWIGQAYMDKAKLTSLDEQGRSTVETQWSAVVDALKNDSNGKIQGPIEWIRIHNLADHAYFNHAQHVAVGQVACQKCHGPVEEMDVVYQYSTLGMGWCINCHRETSVKFTENDYYKQYERYHKELVTKDKEGKVMRDKVTVEEIGGLECQKCHY
jgi:mono/diheme cytochrome c family protein